LSSITTSADFLGADDPRRAQRRLRVTVLAGGPGSERSVSLQSGAAIAEALRRRGHEVHLADIDPDNLAALDVAADVVFPALHGLFGEDGQLQAILERRGVAFVGSGSAASAIAIDKVQTKQRAETLGIRTPESQVLTAPVAAPPWPSCVVKPIDQGSSVLTAIVHDAGGFSAALQGVLESTGRALVERFIRGKELTVGVIAGRALPPIRIRPSRPFYDFSAKYDDDATEYLFETDVPAERERQVCADTERIFAALGCRHLARADWMVDEDGVAWFLEINTMPGFTSHSLTPKAAARVGVPFDELVERLAFMALKDAR